MLSLCWCFTTGFKQANTQPSETDLKTKRPIEVMDCRRIFTFMGGLAVCVAMKDFFHQIHGETSRERPGDLTDGTDVFRTSIARIDDEDPIDKFRELKNAGKELQLSPLNQDITIDRINIPPDQRKSENHQQPKILDMMGLRRTLSKFLKPKTNPM
ncbi:hypothetical protein PGT21_032463 [Puccinia graminis f. sp. tritici]|uniref:Uncharacterized protein n=1 Tax=Puccinia graminis f. sp. tritici TaxID=56615 RepID=A0A5B0M086_PUCGR|nr:hypothetical protein PGT21_032463 [Puccinia graminis f. sp. tritici]